MHDIITIAGALQHVATSAPTNTPVEIIAWIGIPVFLAICGMIFAVIKGAVRFAQYMTKSENSQAEIAKTNTEIRDTLSLYMAKTDSHLGLHDQEIAVLKFAMGPNGAPRRNRAIAEGLGHG